MGFLRWVQLRTGPCPTFYYPNGIIDARSASPLAPDLVAAISDEGLWNSASSLSPCNQKYTMRSDILILDRIVSRFGTSTWKGVFKRLLFLWILLDSHRLNTGPIISFFLSLDWLLGQWLLVSDGPTFCVFLGQTSDSLALWLSGRRAACEHVEWGIATCRVFVSECTWFGVHKCQRGQERQLLWSSAAWDYHPTCDIKKLRDGIFLYGVRLRVTLFAAQMAGWYRGAGAEPGLEIWRIENKVPVVAHILYEMYP